MAADRRAVPATDLRPAGESGLGTSGLYKSGLYKLGLYKSGMGESYFGSGMPFSRIQVRLAALSGWRRAGTAIVFGALAALALPPVYALPFLVVAFTGLFWLLDGCRTVKAAAWTGWCFGLGFFSAGVYWVGLALLTDPERYGLLAPFAPLSLAAFLAIYPAAASALTKFATRWPPFKNDVSRILIFAVFWTAMEWLRGRAFTGFAWNPIGSVWGVSDAMLQFCALFGVYGLSLVTVIASAMPAILGEGLGERETPSGKRPLVVAYAVLGLIWAGGEFRLMAAGNVNDEPVVPHVLLRLVQPDVAQDSKWREELRVAHLKLDLELTNDAAVKNPAPKDTNVFVIWPETAMPFLVDQDPNARAAIAAVVPENGLVITGAPRATPPDSEPFQVWNGIVAVNERGEVVGGYNKFHLVPFGEYLPLRKFIPVWLGLSKLTPGTTDFSAGPGPETLHLPGLPPIGPLICYEIIFPGEVADENDRPGLFVNVTNDAWFGTSSGPYQHFESARFRAIEEGVPVARAANTGISGVIDPWGRVIARLGLNRQGSIDAPLPQALQNATVFARLGNYTILLLMAGAVVFAVLRYRSQ
jgi:apolipoprotein N-acyltransferase